MLSAVLRKNHALVIVDDANDGMPPDVELCDDPTKMWSYEEQRCVLPYADAETPESPTPAPVPAPAPPTCPETKCTDGCTTSAGDLADTNKDCCLTKDELLVELRKSCDEYRGNASIHLFRQCPQPEGNAKWSVTCANLNSEDNSCECEANDLL